MSLSVPNTGATAVVSQEIGGDDPGEVGDVVELPADGWERGGDDGLVKRGQEHRQHQADQDGADFVRGQRRARRDRRRVRDRDHLGRDFRKLGVDLFGQAMGSGRETAPPFVFVHGEYFCPERRQGSADSLLSSLNLGGNSPLRQHPRCMGASRSATSPRQPSQVSDLPNGSGFGPLLQPRPLG